MSLKSTGTPRSCNPKLFCFNSIPWAVSTVNLPVLHVYLSDPVLCWVLWRFYVFVCVCVCLHVMICSCMSVCVSTAGLDIGALADGSPVALQSQAGRRTPRTLPEEPLDGILSPELDKMVTDGQCKRPKFQRLYIFL